MRREWRDNGLGLALLGAGNSLRDAYAVLEATGEIDNAYSELEFDIVAVDRGLNKVMAL